MRSIVICLAVLAALLLAAPSSAAALTASEVRVGARPGLVRVVVDFTGGPFELNEANVDDPSPQPSGRGRARVLLTSDAGKFKYVRVRRRTARWTAWCRCAWRSCPERAGAYAAIGPYSSVSARC